MLDNQIAQIRLAIMFAISFLFCTVDFVELVIFIKYKRHYRLLLFPV